VNQKSWREVTEKINLVGARYTVHDEDGENVTQDTCDSLVFLHEANGWVFFLLRPCGWTNGPQYQHLVETALDNLEATLEPLHFKMVREDGWTVTLSPLNEEQKQDWINWREYRQKQEWYERVDSETITKWSESAKEWRPRPGRISEGFRKSEITRGTEP